MSGGNIDTVTMGAVIQKGMIARGRIMNFEVELPDTPGQLVKVAQLLARERANVIALDHDQFKASGHYTNAVSLGVTVETNGPDHIDHILMALKEAASSQAHLLTPWVSAGFRRCEMKRCGFDADDMRGCPDHLVRHPRCV